MKVTPERIRKLRSSLNLTQVEMGILFGYKPKSAGQHIHDLEKERRERTVPAHLKPLVIMLEKHGADALKEFLAETKASNDA